LYYYQSVLKQLFIDASLNENLFRYTSGRWLYNESEQMAQRYTKFDVGALHRVIFNVCGSPVVAMEKKEGLFNKSFMITLADGQQVTARIKVGLHAIAKRKLYSRIICRTQLLAPITS
jgi:hypothetical protein